MFHNLIPQQFLYGDGTTQSQRPADALAPGYAVPDARSTADLLAFAQKYARFIRFFGEDNTPLGTWEAFLPGKAPGAPGETATPQAEGQWLADISAYLNDPQRFADRPELQQRLSRPHLVLFLTFLQLLEPIREQLNGFTGRHLEYYYRQVLGMSTAKAVPDLAHVIVSLAENIDQLFLPQGTALLAGKDSLGKNLVYRAVKSTGISRARLQRSAKLFVDKERLTLKTIREAAATELDAGFLRMMRFAHGFLRPAEPYPSEPTYLTKAALADSSKKLFISLPDATFLLELQEYSKNGQGSSAQWEKAYFILEQALKDKTIFDRQQALKKFRESSDEPLSEKMLLNLLRFTFGVPGLQALLPASPGPAARPPAGPGDDELWDLAKENLTERELQLVHGTASQTSAKDWDSVYVALERAARKQGNSALPVPLQEVWGNVYAGDEARGEAAGPAPLAHLGLAVASPQLALAEGVRKLTLTCSFQPAGAPPLDALRQALAAHPAAITWALSSPKGWLAVEPSSPLQFGNFVIGSAALAYAFAVPNGVPTRAEKAKLTAADQGKYLVTSDGAIYLLTADPAPATTVSLAPKGTASSKPTAGLYNPAQVYLYAMQVQFMRAATDPPVAAPGAADAAWPMQGAVPVLALRLNQARPAAPANEQGVKDIYQLFRELKLGRLKVEVVVTGIRTLRLQNDYGAVNGKKPFEPFGPSPQPGTSLYLAHPELSSKRLDSLTLTPQWMGAPADFGTHYANYWKIRALSPDMKEADFDIKKNTDFTAELRVIDQQLEGITQKVTLFEPATPWHLDFLAGQAKRQDPDGDETDLLEWNRYFQLELASPDFQHAAYAELLVQQAFLDAVKYEKLRQLRLNPPYTPLLKSLTADYTASFEVEQGGGGASAEDQVLHLGPFGYKALTLAPTISFLPFPDYRSELLLGLSAVDTPQVLPLFFQLAEATTQPDLTPGPLAWSYLAGNEWQPLGEAAVVSDTTNGLLNTGILELQLPAAPAGSTTENTWLPKGLYWLKAGFEAPIEAVPAIIDIQAQGISVRFDEQGNAADHLLAPLPPDSITKPLADIPAIAKLRQPYSSSGGRPAETAAVFYNRVSERVRHKNRALTAWDYERLVLEGFPQIYKAKCLPAASAPGGVDLIVIPDIRGQLLTAAPEPRASAALLLQIRQFVEQRAPAYAAIQVKNPSYMRVKVRAALKIRPGYGEAQAVRQLEADLKRYLAPWAYEEGTDIIVGGKLYPDMIVNFIASKSYVEFAASVLLFLSEDGLQYIPVEQMLGGSNAQNRTLPPEFILVSAPEHVFDIIRESRFEERLLTGIGYAKIGLDFAVG